MDKPDDKMKPHDWKADIQAMADSLDPRYGPDAPIEFVVSARFAASHSLKDGQRIDDWIIPRRQLTIRVAKGSY